MTQLVKFTREFTARAAPTGSTRNARGTAYNITHSHNNGRKVGTMTGVVSVAAGLVCLVAAVLMWTVGGQHTPRLVTLLVLTGVSGILGTWAGHKLHQGVDFADHAVASVTGQLTGVVVVGILGAVLLYVLVVDMWQKKVTMRTLLVAAALPITVVSIPGAFGSLATGLVSGVAGAVGKGVSAAFGLG